jgi:hypothetical protein
VTKVKHPISEDGVAQTVMDLLAALGRLLDGFGTSSFHDPYEIPVGLAVEQNKKRESQQGDDEDAGDYGAWKGHCCEKG